LIGIGLPDTFLASTTCADLIAIDQPPIRNMSSPALQVVKNHSWKFLCLIVLLAFGLRLYFLVTHGAVIENEGAGYAQEAEELLSGRKLGSAEGGPDLVDTWFYPFLIAATTALIKNSEIATRIVALMAGTCLVFPMYFLVLRMYGRGAATVVAALVAVHPLLVALSIAGYTEGLHLTLMMGGIYWAMRMLEPVSGRSWLFAGILFGCAYLNRPEALVLPFFTTLLVVTVTFLGKCNWKNATISLAGFLAVFFLLASPYVIFFWRQTGMIRFEGKNLVNYTIGQRILSGMSYAQASRGIDDNLNAVGPLLDQNRFATHSPYPTDVRSVVQYFSRMQRFRRFWLYFDVVTSFALGSMVLWFLAGLGLVGMSWDRRRFFQELLLLGVFSYLLIVLLAAHASFLRYSFPLLPFLLVWASKGITNLYSWAKNSATVILLDQRAAAAWIGCAVAAIPLVFVIACSADGLPQVGELESGWPRNFPLKEAGLWLRAHQPGPKNIFSSTVMAYYADAYQLIFPYTDGELALHYIHKMDPDFIVIEPYSGAFAPYLVSWAKQGIPDSQAKLIYDGGTPQSGRIQIYSWKYRSDP
jgi:4-amino-4-deoxy-L-arabinose transferase-like glycosyltransferase